MAPLAGRLPTAGLYRPSAVILSPFHLRLGQLATGVNTKVGGYLLCGYCQDERTRPK